MDRLSLIKGGIALAVVILVLAISPLIRQSEANTGTIISQILGNSTTESIDLTMTEVQKHNLASDCWIVIENKVYALETYVKGHPGRASRITDNCGKDGSQDYQNRDGKGKDHSANARKLLVNYYIGDLGTTINTTITSGGASSTTVLQNSVEEAIQEMYP